MTHCHFAYKRPFQKPSDTNAAMAHQQAGPAKGGMFGLGYGVAYPSRSALGPSYSGTMRSVAIQERNRRKQAEVARARARMQRIEKNRSAIAVDVPTIEGLVPFLAKMQRVMVKHGYWSPECPAVALRDNLTLAQLNALSQHQRQQRLQKIRQEDLVKLDTFYRLSQDMFATDTNEAYNEITKENFGRQRFFKCLSFVDDKGISEYAKFFAQYVFYSLDDKDGRINIRGAVALLAIVERLMLCFASVDMQLHAVFKKLAQFPCSDTKVVKADYMKELCAALGDRRALKLQKLRPIHDAIVLLHSPASKNEETNTAIREHLNFYEHPVTCALRIIFDEKSNIDSSVPCKTLKSGNTNKANMERRAERAALLRRPSAQRYIQGARGRKAKSQFDQSNRR